MRCANVILLAFLEGDQDLELIDNVMALAKKYGGRQHQGQPVRVVQAMASIGEDIVAKFMKDEAAQLDALKASADNGLYLIIHAGATTSKPPADVLAKLTADFINAGIRFRKVNLAGCYTGGNKLGNVKSSVLPQFCRALLAAVPTPGMGTNDALAGLHVAAYLTQVTTYDEDSGYYMGLRKDFASQSLKVPAFGPGEVHNLRQDGAGLHATHPRATGPQAQAIEQHVTALRTDALKSKPMKAVKNAPDAFTDVERDKLAAQMGASAKKPSIPSLGQAERALMTDYDCYMRTKIAVRFEGNPRSFVTASLAEYTDNDDVRTLVTQVRTLNGPSQYAYAFHL